MNHTELFSPFVGFSPLDIAIGFCDCDLRLPPGWVNGPRLCDEIAIQCCISGRGVLVSDGRAFPIKEGQCFVSFPNTVTEERADKNHPWRHLWVTFRSDQVVTMLEQIGITPHSPIFPWNYNEKIEKIIHKMIMARISIPVSDPTHYLRQHNLLTELLLEVFHLTQSTLDIPSAWSIQDNYVLMALSYIQQHYNEPMTIADIAEHVGLTRSYLYVVFHKATGMSIQKYIIEYRIKKACDFLTLPQANITSVANSVGYNLLSFSNLFKRTLGITPSAYRRRALEQRSSLRTSLNNQSPV